MATSIESLVSWSAPKHGIRTARGVRSLRTAQPTPAFWAAWRANKAGLQAQGISCSKDDDGNWSVLHWMKPDDATTLKPTATPAPSRGETVDHAIDCDYAARESAAANLYEPAHMVTEAAAVVFKANGTVDPKHAGVNWSGEQLAILNHFSSQPGNLVVEARAGTGKTFTVTHGISLAPENDIVYLVFNKKNEREAKAKISDPRATVRTLNAMGFRCVTNVWRGVKPDDLVEIDRVESVFRDCPSELLTPVLQLVGFAKNKFCGLPTEGDLASLADERDIFCALQDDAGNDEFPVTELARIARKTMQAAMVKDPAGRISYNDQVWLAVAMGWVRPSFDLVVVDETQDVNAPQLEMVKRLVRKGGRVVVVGDEFQAIYGFRGAVQDGMKIMQRALNAKTLPMTVTRRCGKAIVRLAQTKVADYKAADDAPEGEVLACDQVQLLDQAKVGDAILSRINAPLMSVCLQLLKRGTPARIEGRDIGQQLIGIVKKLNAKSVPDFFKRLARWEDKQLGRLKNAKNSEAKVAAVRDTRETLEAVAEGCANVGEITARIKGLFQNSDDEGVKPAVVLSSVHKAKGLEFDRVFSLTWTFNKRKPKSPAEAQEEQNIYYVAVTRAKSTLFMVSEGGEPNTVKAQPDGTKTGSI